MDIVVIGLVAVVAALVIWTTVVLLRHYAALDRPVRLSQMLARLGLSIEDIANSELANHLPTAARQCMVCGSAAACDHVLEGETELDEPPAFCPNAGFIRLVRQSTRVR